MTLETNSENTEEILEMQQSLRTHILNSITNQEKMSELLTNSSLTITSLTGNITSSLTQIHQDIDTHYAIVSRVLAALDKVLGNIAFLESYLIASTHSVQGVVFFLGLLISIFASCMFSVRARIRAKENLLFVTLNFFFEYFLGEPIGCLIGIQKIRMVVLCILTLRTFLTQEDKDPNEKLQQALNSERMSRLMEKAVRRQIEEL